MRSTLSLRRSTAVAAAVAWALSGASPAASARTAPEVIRAAGVDQIFVLGDAVVYRSGHRWRRVIDGQEAPARGVPPRSRASSIGRDGAGRIVVTFTRPPKGPGPSRARWWVYDVLRDTAHPLSIPTRRMCFASAVALWRSRVAFAEHCWQRLGATGSGPQWGVSGDDIVLDDGERVRRADVGFLSTQLALRGRSLAAIVDQDDQQSVWRIADHGRWCPRSLHRVDAEEDSLAPIAIRRGSVAWGTADTHWTRADPWYAHFLLTDVALAGRCQEAPPVRVLDDGIPDRGIQAAAIGADALVYATDRGIHRQRLARAGSTAPPRNDDFERATRISGPLPLEVFGRTGYATAQAGEPIFDGARPTVWYALTAERTQTVYLDLTYGWAYNVFAGSAVSALTPLLPWRYGTSHDCVVALAVEAGQTYRLSVGAGEWNTGPDFRPFIIRIDRSSELPACRS